MGALLLAKAWLVNCLSFPFSSWYYCLHVCSILVLLLLPGKKSQRGKSTQENVQLSRVKKFDERENSLGQNSFPTTNNVCSQNQDTASRHSSLTQWPGECVMAVSRLWTETSLDAFPETNWVEVGQSQMGDFLYTRLEMEWNNPSHAMFLWVTPYTKSFHVSIGHSDLSLCPQGHTCALSLNVHCVSRGPEEVEEWSCQSGRL